MNCPKCGKPTKCLSGHSGHPLNWYCSDEQGCGWQAWDTSQKENEMTDISKLAEALRRRVSLFREIADTAETKGCDHDAALLRVVAGQIEHDLQAHAAKVPTAADKLAEALRDLVKRGRLVTIGSHRNTQ